MIYDELLSLPSSPSGGHALPMQRLSARETACLMLAAVPALACAAAERVAPDGHVVGIDPNEQMLAVARGKRGDVEWQMGRAEALPFTNASFDAVVSQFALMFVESKSDAIGEMLRVLRPGGGRLAVAVWDALDRVPGYLALMELLRELFGRNVADAMHAPFTLGDLIEFGNCSWMPAPRMQRSSGVGAPFASRRSMQ